MNFLEDWKSYFSVSPCHAPMLVAYSERPALGPLIFNPNPQTLTQLFSSPSLLPPPIHTPQLPLPQYIATATPNAPILPSTASSIASLFGSQTHDTFPDAFHCNKLEILKYQNKVLLFFPTGENFEHIGFLMLCYLEGSGLQVMLNGNKDIFKVSCAECGRISKILVNPIDNGDESSSIVGFLLVFKCYTIHWFSICCDSHSEIPSVVHVDCKTFKFPIAHVCWSPHIFEESLVLLENGEIFLFDIGGDEEAHFLKETKLKLKWPDLDCLKNPVWTCCEFSYSARSFIATTNDRVLLVNWTKDTYDVSCLLTVNLLPMHDQAQNERFLALSMVGPDNFYFTVASSNFLLLCDVRKPMMPILQWAHDIYNPTYINVVNLFQLRSHSTEETFDSASKAGFCIILGSFFNGNFKFFCYGSSLPSSKGSFASRFLKTNKTFYPWELPYELAISGHYCHCGNCLLKEEWSKEHLSEWINWQTKKDMVLGFSILSNDLASLLPESDKKAGFTLIRLMSSGKLELQRYQASWVTEERSKICNGQGVPLNRYLFSVVDEEYKCTKGFTFLRSNYLYSYFRGSLIECLVQKIKGIKDRGKKSLDEEVHKVLCEKLNGCKVVSSRSHSIASCFDDVMSSASLYEVALRGLWAKLPLHILQLAFSKQSEFVAGKTKVYLGFPVVPPQNQLPPFFLRKSSSHNKLLRKSSPCSNNRSNKVQCNNGISDGKKCDISEEKKCNDYIVGPTLPLAFLVGLQKIGDESSYSKDPQFSVEAEVSRQCEEVMKMAGKISVSTLEPELFDDIAVSHEGPKSFVLYRPTLFECPAADLLCGNFDDQYAIHHTLAFNVQENKTVSIEKSEAVDRGIANDISSSTLGSNASNEKFGPCDLKAYDILTKHMSRWKDGFGPYNKFCLQTKIQKAINK